MRHQELLAALRSIRDVPAERPPLKLPDWTLRLRSFPRPSGWTLSEAGVAFLEQLERVEDILGLLGEAKDVLVELTAAHAVAVDDVWMKKTIAELSSR